MVIRFVPWNTSGLDGVGYQLNLRLPMDISKNMVKRFSQRRLKFNFAPHKLERIMLLRVDLILYLSSCDKK